MLDAKKGCQTIKLINMAQLSELTGRKTVTMEDFDAFVQQHKKQTPLETGDAMASVLTQPYQLPNKE